MGCQSYWRNPTQWSIRSCSLQLYYVDRQSFQWPGPWPSSSKSSWTILRERNQRCRSQCHAFIFDIWVAKRRRIFLVPLALSLPSRRPKTVLVLGGRRDQSHARPHNYWRDADKDWTVQKQFGENLLLFEKASWSVYQQEDSQFGVYDETWGLCWYTYFWN